MSRDWEDVHTCHAECPCQTGGEPSPDFLPVEAAATLMMLQMGIPAREVAAMLSDSRRRNSRAFRREHGQ